MKMAENNVVGWFEIPVTDMERATDFYQKVFDFELSKFLFKEVILHMWW